MARANVLMAGLLACCVCASLASSAPLSLQSKLARIARRQEEEHEDPVHDIIHHFDKNDDDKLSAEEFDKLFDELFGAAGDEHGGHEEEDDGHGHGAQTNAQKNLRNSGENEVQFKELRAKRAEMESKEEGAHCHPVVEIFAENDVDANGLLNETEVEAATPTLLAMIVDKCKAKKTECDAPDAGLAWMGAIVATIIISLLSLLVIVFLPIAHDPRVKGIMLAFAVGALVGDAVVHLIPQALGAHGHGDEEAAGELDYLGPAIMICVGVLLFFLLERQLSHFHHHGTEAINEEMTEGQTKQGSSGSASDIIDKNAPWYSRYHPLGYMILVGDALHNLVDGLAIGIAFSVSPSAGIATSIAVFFHEVPQELADFAMLLRAGFEHYQAVLVNFASSATAVIGAIIGVAAGTALGDANKYIIALVAGGFLYIALSDMVAELLEAKGLQTTIIQALVIMIGFLIMILIVLVESEIHADC